MHLSSGMASFMIRRFAQASSACSLIKEVLDLLMVLLQHGEEQDPQNNPIVGLPYRCLWGAIS